MKFDVDRLPRGLKEMLAAAGKGQAPEGGLAFSLEGFGGKIFMVVLGVAAAAAPALYLNDYWSIRPFDEVMTVTAACTLGCWILLSGLGRILGLVRAAVRPCLVIGRTHLAMVEEVGGPVEIVGLADLQRVVLNKNTGGVALLRGEQPALKPDVGGAGEQVASAVAARIAALQAAPAPSGGPDDWAHEAQGARAEARAPSGGLTSWLYSLTIFALAVVLAVAGIWQVWMAQTTRNVERQWERVKDKTEAEDWARYIKDRYRVADELLTKDMLPPDLAEEARWRYKKGTKIVLRRTRTLEYFQEALKRYDTLRFQEAAAGSKAGPLRAYLRNHPEGAHVAEAREALAERYRSALEKYVNTASGEGASEQLVEGMKRLFDHLREGDPLDSTVGIAFLPPKGLESGEIEKKMLAETGAKSVHPVGPSFTQKQNEGREHRIVESMNSALQRVVGDLFEVEKVELDAPGPRFLVQFAVAGSGSHYYSKSQAEKPMSERDLFVGIFVIFRCTLQIPEGDAAAPADPAEGYGWATIATPAMNFSVSSRGGRSFERAVYDRMAETAFGAFSQKLSVALGMVKGK